MKKTMLFIAIICMQSQKINAQAAILAAIFGDQVASEKFNLSLELGVPFNNFSNIDGSKTKPGVNFGIAGNIKLSDRWFLNPSAYFASRRTVSLDNMSLMTSDADLNSKFQNTNANILINYIEVPLFVHYRTKSNFEFGLAPQVSFRQKSFATFKNDQGEFKTPIGSSINKTDYGVIFSAGYFFKYGSKGNGLSTYLRYYQGITDVFKNQFVANNNKSNYVSVVLSFPFLTVDKAYENYKEGQKEKAKK